MAGVTVAQRMTAAEYLGRGVEQRGAELVGGEIVVEEPLLPHELVLSEIHMALWAWTRERDGRGLAIRAIDVGIGDYDVYAPDALWYAEGRVPARSDGRPYPVPDLAIEARSPSTWRYDLGAKKAGYERRGLPELWLVDTAAEAVLVFRRSRPASPSFDVALELERGDALTSPLLPGFALAVDAVFGLP